MVREIRNAKIETTRIEIEDHGMLTLWLILDYGGSGQGFGGYAIDGPFAGPWIRGILETLEIYDWADLTGMVIRADFEHSKVHRIGHALKDRWFDPSTLEPQVKEQCKKFLARERVA